MQGQRRPRRTPGPGSKGPAVKCLQDRLAALHYVTSRSGVYDAATGRAIMAWRKVAGYSRTYVATADVFAGMLKGRGVFKVRHPKDGRHVEARLNQQVLALINGGKVERIYHTSSGTPVDADRPGQVPRLHEDAGHQRQGHGRLELLHPRLRHPRLRRRCPPYNASHGCLRVPVPNARSIYDWLRIGDVVWVEP